MSFKTNYYELDVSKNGFAMIDIESYYNKSEVTVDGRVIDTSNYEVYWNLVDFKQYLTA